MSKSARIFSSIEPLEARIAPAVAITNHLPGIEVGPGKTGTTIDLSKLTAPLAADAYHTKVKFTTNVDGDPNTAGVQGDIVIELFDQDAPRTVQNFLAYVNSLDPASDYDGTIIHRSFNFGDVDPDGTGPLTAPSQPGIDIIQGGGFAYPGFGHIPVGTEVFNEYNPAHKNVAGTIALAKTALGPSTGTSEWFFNVTDNSNTLGGPESPTGNNNGGFTVFGKVVSGMAVVNKIATLSKVSFGGALTDLPVQNGYSSGTPTENQVLRITDAVVIPSVAAATGLTYEVSFHQVTADGLVTTKTSTLVTGKITGTELALTYAKGRSGRADVVVSVSDGVDTKEETFRVDLRPNLFVIDNGQQVIVPGDATPLTFKVINDGAATISGSAELTFQIKRTDVAGATASDLPFSQTVSVNVAAGAAQTFTVKVPIPQTLAQSQKETYQVIATLQPLAAERAQLDNVSSGGSHPLLNAFGAVDGRANVILKYRNGGSSETWTMTGAGTGQLIPDGSGHFTLKTSGTSLTSTVAATASLATVHPTLSGVQFDDLIGTANLGIVNVAGPVVAAGGIKTLTLGDLTGPSLMLIGSVLSAPATAATLKLGSVTDFSVESDMPIAALTATQWFDASDIAGAVAPDTITAPSLGTLKTPGEFGADITLTENVPLKSIVIGKLLNRSTIKTAGNIGTVTVGGIYYSNIFAGLEARPDSVDDFTDARTIQSFTIAGITGRTDLFTNSLLAAQTLGTIKLKGVVKGGSGSLGDLGLVADVIKSYSRIDPLPPSNVVRSNVTAPEVFDNLGNFKVKVL